MRRPLLLRHDAHDLDEDVRLQEHASHLRGVEPAQVVLAVGEEDEQGAPAARGEQRSGVEGVVEGRGAAGQDAAHRALETRPVTRRRHAHLDLLVEGHQGGLVSGAQPVEQRPRRRLKPEELLARHAAARVEDQEGGERQRLDGHQLHRLSHAVVLQLEVRRREADHGAVAVGHEDVHVHAFDAHGERGGRRRLGADAAATSASARPLTTWPPVAAPRAGLPPRRRDPRDRARARPAAGGGPPSPTAFSTSARAPAASPRRRRTWLRASRADWERGSSAEGGLVGARGVVEPAGVLVEPAEEQVGEERRRGIRLPGEDLQERRPGLGRLAEPPGHAAQAEARLRERRVDGECRAQGALGVLEVLADLATVEQLGPAPPGVGIDEGLVRRTRLRLACVFSIEPCVSSIEAWTSSISTESGKSRRPRSAQASASSQRVSACARLAIASYHRRAKARWEGSSFIRLATSTAADSWRRGDCPSRRALCAQSLWSIRAALTGIRSHASAARHRWQACAFFQRALRAVISSRRRRSDQAFMSAIAPSRSPDW